MYVVEKMIHILKEGSASIPKILLFHYKELNIEDKELIFLMYLLNEELLFNPKKIGYDLQISMAEVLEMIEKLTSKGFLKLEVIKVKNIREEHLNLDGLYDKLSFLIVNEKIDSDEKSNLFDIFEQEFGRTLSPIEYEIIKGWEESNFSEELIICALKEAVYNGVFRMNYIDKILFEWNKKGIRTKRDVEKNNIQFNNRKKEKTEEVFAYDWLNENE